MDLTPHVENLRHELMAAADPGDATAERLVTTVTAAARLTMFDVLTSAADEITRDLVPGSVEVRLRGRNPFFVVTSPMAKDDFGDDDTDLDTASREPVLADENPKPGSAARISFRPSEHLKHSIESAAEAEGVSVNAWLIRAANAALSRDSRPDPARGSRRVNHLAGWVG
jgi:hypothetical protein